MELIIAEKPSVARAIAEAVGAHDGHDGYIEGGGFVVSWCRGHLVDLDDPSSYPEWAGRWSLDKLPMVPAAWRWHVAEGAEAQYATLASLMGRADVDAVVNACDADREGEGIFRRVYRHAGCEKPVRRLWSTSLVAEQVLDDLARARPASDYDGLADAAEGRAKADWLVGMNASRAYSCLYDPAKFAVGRVQTPTLALVARRTAEIEGFRSVPFYQSAIDLGGWEAFSRRFDDAGEAEAAAAAALGSRATVTAAERREERNGAPRLYDLTSLQRDASTRAGLTAEETLTALQALYEAKLATYPRADSKYIGESERAGAEAVLARVADPAVTGAAGAAFDPARADVGRVVDDGKVHGHSAILPTAALDAESMAGLEGAERAVMTLVCCRLLAAVMEPATRLRSRVELECGGTAYTASGSVVTDPSWMAVDDACREALGGRPEEAGDGGDPEQPIPAGPREGEAVAVAGSRVKEGKTSPPRPYTDATLLSAMEHAGRSIEDGELKAAIDDDTSHSAGLGTPATRADTIEKLVSSGYVERKGRSLVATESGRALVDTVAPSLKTPELTARWELELSRIESGEEDLSAFMSGIAEYASQVVSDARGSFDPSRRAALVGRSSLGPCPACGAPVVRKGGLVTCSSNRFAGPDDGYKLLEGCGFKLFAKQCGKPLTDSQVGRLLSGATVHLTGLASRKGTTFEADATIGQAPYDGRVKLDFGRGGRRPNGGRGTGGGRGRPGGRR